MLARFDIIVATDVSGGISRRGEIPWKSKADTSFFRSKVIETGRSAVIMGKQTYETLDPPIPFVSIVLSSTLPVMANVDIIVFKTMVDALAHLGQTKKQYDRIFVWGGERVYTEAMTRFLYLVDKVHHLKFHANYECDKKFPISKLNSLTQLGEPLKSKDFTKYTYSPAAPDPPPYYSFVTHQETQYLTLLDKLIHAEITLPIATQPEQRRVQNVSLSFDVSQEFPLMTCRRIDTMRVVRESLWYISGNTDCALLPEDSPYHSTQDFVHWGYFLRYWGTEYQGKNFKPEGGLDQLMEVIRALKTEKDYRVLNINLWDPSTQKIPSLHTRYSSITITSTPEVIDMCVQVMTADAFSDIPYDIAYMTILMTLLCRAGGRRPRRLDMQYANVNVLARNIESVRKASQHTPRPFPVLTLNKGIDSIDNIRIDCVRVDDYYPWPEIAYR